MFYTCNTCVGYTPVLHMYFYTCNIGIWYTHYCTCSSTHVIHV